MIPILYEKDEIAFISNGLGRLRDAIEVLVSEERNGVYEASLRYPMSGANFDLIQVGRILGITHDESGDIEPFDIVSYERPIDGVVTFHAVHISYRLSYKTVTASSINSLADAFTAFQSAEPDMPFSFQTDKTSSGYASAFDGLPKTVRSLMGGIEGSILDAYGGEYSFNNWTVYLHTARGQLRDFAIRYGVNMLNYEEAYDSQGTYSSVMPFWTDGTDTVLGDRVDSGGSTITGRGECVPLDVSDKFEAKPTKAEVEAEAMAYMTGNNTYIPSQNIKVDFVRLQDLGYDDLGSLMQCNLCDTIKVIFPDYNSTGTYKIVKTIWNVLEDRYQEMELGQLSVTLSEALGISGGVSFSGGGGGGGGGGVLDFYPVGSYYETSDVYFDPNISWGGTWVKDSAGRVTVAQDTGDGSFDVVGETGGSKYIQAHTHGFTNPTITSYFRNTVSYSSGSAARPYTSSGSSSTTDWARASGGAVGAVKDVSTGSAGNLQPYIVVIRWHRTA